MIELILYCQSPLIAYVCCHVLLFLITVSYLRSCYPPSQRVSCQLAKCHWRLPCQRITAITTTCFVATTRKKHRAETFGTERNAMGVLKCAIFSLGLSFAASLSVAKCSHLRGHLLAVWSLICEYWVHGAIAIFSMVAAYVLAKLLLQVRDQRERTKTVRLADNTFYPLVHFLCKCSPLSRILKSI